MVPFVFWLDVRDGFAPCVLDLHVLFHAACHVAVWHHPFCFVLENWPEIFLAGAFGFVGSSQSLADFTVYFYIIGLTTFLGPSPIAAVHPLSRLTTSVRRGSLHGR